MSRLSDSMDRWGSAELMENCSPYSFWGLLQMRGFGCADIPFLFLALTPNNLNDDSSSSSLLDELKLFCFVTWDTGLDRQTEAKRFNRLHYLQRRLNAGHLPYSFSLPQYLQSLTISLRFWIPFCTDPVDELRVLSDDDFLLTRSIFISSSSDPLISLVLHFNVLSSPTYLCNFIKRQFSLL